MDLPIFETEAGQGYNPLKLHMEFAKAALTGLISDRRDFDGEAVLRMADIVIDAYQKRGWL